MNIIPVFDCYTLRHVIDLVYSDQTRCKFEHVVSKRDDNELCVLRPFFDIACDNRDLVLLALGSAKGVGHSLRF